MTNLSVWEYVVFVNPTKEQREEGYEAEIISTGQLLAQSEEKARMMAIREISSEWDDLLDQVTVLVRSF